MIRDEAASAIQPERAFDVLTALVAREFRDVSLLFETQGRVLAKRTGQVVWTTSKDLIQHVLPSDRFFLIQVYDFPSLTRVELRDC